jgi:bifunctional non-homologous end joining protein LigD
VPAFKFIPLSEPVEQPTPPAGDEWQHEIKWDGFRLELAKHGNDARALSINGRNMTAKVRWIVEAVAALPCRSCVIDAEGVAPTPDGNPDFRALIGGQKHKMAACFDLLELDGHDMRPLPLVTRRAKLATLLKKADPAVLQFSIAYEDPHQLLADLSAIGGEGIVSKKRGQPYVAGRNRGWVKVKCAAWREANRWRGEVFNKRRS